MARQSAIVQRARAMLLDHYLFFCTLTYNNESLPKHTCSNGFSIPYADKADVQNMFKRIRKYNLFGRSYKYLFVSERGSGRGRPHFHGLIFIPRYPSDDKLFPAQLETIVRNTLFHEWRRNYGSTRKPIYKSLFSYHRKFVGGKLFTNFDCHYVVPHSTEQGADDVAFYVTKYVLKPSTKETRLQQALRLNLSPEEFENVWSIVRSRSFTSIGFGAYTPRQTDYIKGCISRSANDPQGLKFYSANGSPSPLARYYRKFVDVPTALSSVSARGGPLAIKSRSYAEKVKALEKGSIILKKASLRDVSELYPND